MAFGDLKVQDLIYEDSSNNEITVVISDLATKNNPAFTGNATGVNLTLSGDLTVNGTTTTINTTTLQVEDKNVEIGKVSSPSDTTADGGGWTLLGATNKTFNWVNATDAWTSSEHIHLGDNKKLLLGTGSDLQISHDGSNSYINNSTGALYLRTGTGLNLQNAGGTETYLYTEENGAVFLRYDNVTKLETTSYGIAVDGTIAPTNHVNLVDDKKAQFGTGYDLQIYHNGLNSIINNSTGWLVLGDGGSGTVIKGAANENAVSCTANGAVELYYDGSIRLATTSAGVNIGGNLSSDSGASFTVNAGGASGTAAHFIARCGSENAIVAVPNGAVEVYYDNVKKLETTSGGVNVTGAITVNGAALGGGVATEYDCWDGGNGTGASDYVRWNYTVIGLTSADDGWFNWSRIGSLTPVGSGMTESAGVWTFPSTGMWKIQLHLNLKMGSAGTSTMQLRPEFSSNSGTSYTNKPVFEWRNNSNYSSYSLESMLYFQNVTNATNDRIRFSMWNSSGVTFGLQGVTKIEFTKVA